MNKLRAVAVAALVSIPACEGFKDAMTAHVDVVARAGSQQLTVQRLADMMGKTPGLPVRKDVAQSIADVWLNYQLAAKAAAANDSLKDTTQIDKVMWPVYSSSRRNKWYSVVSQTWPIDTTNLEQKYNEGEALAASHILFQVPPGQQSTGSDSIKKKAEGVLKQLCPVRVEKAKEGTPPGCGSASASSASFAAMAKKYGSDATKDKGGSLGVFRHGAMIPEFEKAVMGLKPGEIGPLVQTQFGYHIVRRSTYAEVKDAFRAVNDSIQRTRAESAYVAGVEKAGKVEVKPNAAKAVKLLAADPEGHKDDNTVIATSVAGNFTLSQAARWISSTSNPPPQTIRTQLQQAPDSLVPNFVKYLVRDELFLRQADSAKVKLEPTEISSIRQAFRMMVTNTWAGLHIAPEMLTDSAKTPAEKARLAASRVDAYLDRLLKQQDQYVDVPPPLASALHDKYDGKVNAAGLDRAVEAAKKIRANTDSAQAAQQPKSAVPMPTSPRPDSPAKGAEKKKQ
jgi:parvulin-like peptidyl-prolyl isomerase